MFLLPHVDNCLAVGPSGDAFSQRSPKGKVTLSRQPGAGKGTVAEIQTDSKFMPLLAKSLSFQRRESLPFHQSAQPRIEGRIQIIVNGGRIRVVFDSPEAKVWCALLGLDHLPAAPHLGSVGSICSGARPLLRRPREPDAAKS